MGRRPAHCYSRIDRPPYTRKKYMRGGPDSKIRMFDLGSPGTIFEKEIELRAEKPIQISHNALEAARVHVNRYLNTNISREDYHYRICVYPHHIARENKMMTGAGADRVQDGMRKAFGKPIARLARVKEGQVILRVRTHPENINVAKDALRRGKAKMPCPCRIVVQDAKNNPKSYQEQST
ncbi:MAG: 50S ribosomal protein L16 [Candidatus Hodarchaeales archaeon]|jgi:large subunit ribosomal protein L10e